MVAAIGLPREKLCTYCWTGESLYEQEPAPSLPAKRARRDPDLEAVS